MQQRSFISFFVVSIVSLWISILLPSVNSTAPSFTTSSGGIFNYEDPNRGPGYYQTALEYYDSNEASPGSGHFLYMLARVYELDQNGDECCDSGGSSCPYNTGCNDHDMYVINNVFTVTTTVTNSVHSCSFTGNVQAPGDSQSASCDPKNSYGICVPFTFTSTLIDNATSIAVGNQNFPLNKDSIHAQVLITDWPFDPSSTGLRLKLLIMTEDVNLQAMVVQPGDVDVTQDSMNGPTQFDTFTGVTVQDVKNRQGGLNISSYALINGTATKVNISGLYPHDYDLDARYIYVDMPRGATVQYDVNIYIPDVSGVPTGVTPVQSNTATISFIDKNKVYFIVAGCVLGAILLFICIVCIVRAL